MPSLIPAELPTLFLARLMLDNDYPHGKLLSLRHYGVVARFNFTWGILLGEVGDYMSVNARWCYHTEQAALAAFEAWDGTAEPRGWHRAPMSGRRISESPDEYDADDQRVGGVGVEYVRW